MLHCTIMNVPPINGKKTATVKYKYLAFVHESLQMVKYLCTYNNLHIYNICTYM